MQNHTGKYHKNPEAARTFSQSDASGPQPLDLDLETAPGEPRRATGYRAYVGGVLYIEGTVVFLLGASLLFGYWPPLANQKDPGNPVSLVGLWLCGAAVVYMIVVGLGIFLYNLRHPSPIARMTEEEARGIVLRSRRYAAMKRKTRYIFDDTITSESEAEEAILARDLY